MMAKLSSSPLILCCLVCGAMCSQQFNVMRKEPNVDEPINLVSSHHAVSSHNAKVSAAKVASAATTKAIADSEERAKVAMASLEAYSKSYAAQQTMLLSEGHQEKEQAQVIKQDDVTNEGVSPSLLQIDSKSKPESKVASKPASKAKQSHQSQTHQGAKTESRSSTKVAMDAAMNALQKRSASGTKHKEKSSLQKTLDRYAKELKDARSAEMRQRRANAKANAGGKALVEAAVSSPSLLASKPESAAKHSQKSQSHQGAKSQSKTGTAGEMQKAMQSLQRRSSSKKTEEKSSLQKTLDRYAQELKHARTLEMRGRRAAAAAAAAGK